MSNGRHDLNRFLKMNLRPPSAISATAEITVDNTDGMTTCLQLLGGFARLQLLVSATV